MNRSVISNYIVIPNVSDIIQDKDVQLEHALRAAGKNTTVNSAEKAPWAVTYVYYWFYGLLIICTKFGWELPPIIDTRLRIVLPGS